MAPVQSWLRESSKHVKLHTFSTVKSPLMMLASTLYTYVALELHVLLKYVNDGSRIMIKVKATSIYPGV